jgi:hypothetical protein
MTELHYAINVLRIAVIILGCVVVANCVMLIVNFVVELKRIKASKWRWVK